MRKKNNTEEKEKKEGVYCLKCKDYTDTLNKVAGKASNGRNVIKGICVICNQRKQQFATAKDAAKVEVQE